ncbi:proteasome subunit beta [Aciditerrimonas ferrireducens]|uniref:proteasome subunit beta n=1 Tax=Aciditerrimonas ferrireducens TaxID=667306 RepID=UPI002003158F|nr:proteasome subunit beta [Aciditerrimonas ferrireducens]MCK4176627.1 proteasome subunit beta [Aciditerrimonas ferrireducens]
MSLPIFPPGADPGPDFAALLRRVEPAALPWWLGGAGGPPEGARGLRDGRPGHLPHGTTVVALRFADGVVMAGDRRATEGNFIAHRSMEKVFPADRHSAVAVAGAAGPAVEMVRLFQTQLEHYEKVEGVALSLEGKANQLGQMVREHLPMAFQGLAVVPLFAGYDLRRQTGRIFTYDVTGGHYEETDHAATGSGGRDARTTIKLGWRPGLSRAEAIELAVRALYNAADEDAATGGPDAVRGIYPVVALVTAEGYSRVAEDEVAARFADLLARGLGRER